MATANTPLFPDMPPEARCWIYTATEPMSAATQKAFLKRAATFFEDWTSHGRPVHGDAVIRGDRFMIVAAELKGGYISGCGIDASVEMVEQTGEALNVSWLPALMVLYRDPEGTVQHATRSEFRALAKAGEVTSATPVFDPTVNTVGQLRAGAFEQPAHASWHATAFGLANRQPA
ncbi:MAG: hypothetical protein GVY15_10720 [Bacteroidetes bacterium]|nr:hypothetical protein [Bacteroidota bacterium]